MNHRKLVIICIVIVIVAALLLWRLAESDREKQINPRLKKIEQAL